jgi:addiction module RelE/StbE family toxin
MWHVLEHRRVDRQLRRLPTDVLKRYEKWKDIVSISGPQGLRLIKGFRDEALSGKWKGHRSSRLNRQFRVIYHIESDRVLVEVVNVTAHDYERK